MNSYGAFVFRLGGYAYKGYLRWLRKIIINIFVEINIDICLLYKRLCHRIQIFF